MLVYNEIVKQINLATMINNSYKLDRNNYEKNRRNIIAYEYKIQYFTKIKEYIENLKK